MLLVYPGLAHEAGHRRPQHRPSDEPVSLLRVVGRPGDVAGAAAGVLAQVLAGNAKLDVLRLDRTARRLANQVVLVMKLVQASANVVRRIKPRADWRTGHCNWQGNVE